MNTEFEEAQAAFECRDYTVALNRLQSYLDRHCADGRGWEMFGICLNAVSNYETAVWALERASLLVPLTPAGRICIASGYGRVGRTKLSRELLELLIDDDQMTAELLLEIARGLDLVDSLYLALQACRKAVDIDPQSAAAYYLLGYFTGKNGGPPEHVVSLAHKAIHLEPTNTEYRIGLASLLVKLSRDAEAYRVVRDLTDAQIGQITCECCVERIARLFELAGDSRHTKLCLLRHQDAENAE